MDCVWPICVRHPVLDTGTAFGLSVVVTPYQVRGDVCIQAGRSPLRRSDIRKPPRATGRTAPAGQPPTRPTPGTTKRQMNFCRRIINSNNSRLQLFDFTTTFRTNAYTQHFLDVAGTGSHGTLVIRQPRIAFRATGRRHGHEKLLINASRSGMGTGTGIGTRLRNSPWVLGYANK